MGISFEFFEAGCGDSILVSTSEGTHILIDGGEEGTYRDAIEDSLYNKDIHKLDLVVLTHIDNDHICGLIEMMESEEGRNTIQEVWFNSSEGMRVSNNTTDEVGFSEGDSFEDLIHEYEIQHRKDIYFTQSCSRESRIYNIGSDIKLILLSPQKEDLDKLQIKWDIFRESLSQDVAGKSPFDYRDIDEVYTAFQEEVLSKKDKTKTLATATSTSLANRTSIAFILEYRDKQFLFLGDADIKVINQSLIDLGFNELNVEFVKLSHHGSKKNINREFLDIVKTDTFVILTDGTRHNHPDKETLSLILRHESRADNVKFIFNHARPIEYKFPRDKNEENQYLFEAIHENEVEL